MRDLPINDNDLDRRDARPRLLGARRHHAAATGDARAVLIRLRFFLTPETAYNLPQPDRERHAAARDEPLTENRRTARSSTIISVRTRRADVTLEVRQCAPA